MLKNSFLFAKIKAIVKSNKFFFKVYSWKYTTKLYITKPFSSSSITLNEHNQKPKNDMFKNWLTEANFYFL